MLRYTTFVEVMVTQFSMRFFKQSVIPTLRYAESGTLGCCWPDSTSALIMHVSQSHMHLNTVPLISVSCVYVRSVFQSALSIVVMPGLA